MRSTLFALVLLGFALWFWSEARRYHERAVRVVKRAVSNSGAQLLDEDEWGGKCAPAEVPILVKGTAVAGFGFLSPHKVCTCAACSQSSGSGALEQQRKHDQQLADQRKDAEDRFLRLMRAVEAGLPRTTSEDECRCDRVCGCGGGNGSRCALHFRDTRPLTCVHVTSGNSFSVC